MALQDYGDLLMEVFDDVQYEDAQLGDPDILSSLGIRFIKVQERSRSEFDARNQTCWTLHDTLVATERSGEPQIDRIVVLQKEMQTGTVYLGLSNSTQEVRVTSTDHSLPLDFNQRDEFIQGLGVLAASSTNKG
jgi:hypothetical protein